MSIGKVTVALPEHPFHPRFSACYEGSFETSRRKLGLGGQNFDHFFRDVEQHLLDYPWQYSREIPDSNGMRILGTREGFEDLPPLYVYFRVDAEARQVRFYGVSKAWSQEETT